MSFPSRSLGQVPAVTVEQMREVDRLMISHAGVSLLQMMENAGRSLAALAVTRYRPATATVLVGSGGNGGGGMVAARHLTNRGVDVSFSLASDSLGEVPRHQFDILNRMEVELASEPQPADLIVDAVIGYSLAGDPRGHAAELIEWANGRSEPTLALDVPSGVDSENGAAGNPAVAADATLTLALPKRGLVASSLVGELFLADISVPRTVYAEVGVAVTPELFAGGQIVHLDRS